MNWTKNLMRATESHNMIVNTLPRIWLQQSTIVAIS